VAFGELSMLQMPADFDEEPRRARWLELLSEAVAHLERWEQRWPAFDPVLGTGEEAASRAVLRLAERLEDNLPYFHPQYAGHMLKAPHPVAWVAYALAMLVNPNNQTREVGQATTDMELEVVDRLAGMLGFESGYLGHLTTSGTIANLEAMWVARNSHPGRAIACTPAAHYNYSRIADLIGAPLIELPARADETIDPQGLAALLEREDVGTIVATLGTTGLGVVDPLDEIVDIASRHGARVHVDAAYGGFFALSAAAATPLVDPAPFEAIASADSVTIDPHKHGLQPYGCGCVIFADAQVARNYDHNSPYTYLDPSSLHLGQIQLECSRAGAAAAALWTTLEAVALEPDRGMGAILAACRRAALAWSQAIGDSPCLRTVVEPHLDIVSFVVWPHRAQSVRASDVSRWTHRLLELGARDDESPIYLTRYDLDCQTAQALLPELDADTDSVSVLRSCVMKPEHEEWWLHLHRRASETAWHILEEEGVEGFRG
jgi:glutamate/tyrosine decarboxylase-like PLP-dependent enzyme